MVIRKKAVENEVLIEKISKFLYKINIDFKDISHYILAFIHKSIVNEKPDYTPTHNERLEFLGDAVLELAVTDNLFNEFEKKPEGELTDIRSALVRGRNLAKVARNLGLSEYLLLGKGEEGSGGRNNDYLLANTVESLIGAIYIDLGIEESRNFINKHIYSTLGEILKENLIKDFKTNIQELSQAEFDITPHYKILDEHGPDHDKTFKIGVFLEEKKIGEGVGTSKKKAQEDAAKNAYLDIINKK